jgi:Ubiquitin-activating enzyme E1 FCCH domain
MARVGVQQASFAAGELSPRLHGRTDFQRYASGAETIENFIVRPEGGLMRRHGTRFAGETKFHDKAALLVPFVVSTIQPYMLEFGDAYIRVWKNNAPIVSASNAISGITKANPAVVTYVGADNFANGDRVVVTGVTGMGQVNNREFTVANVNAGANTFELSGVNSSAYDTYVSGGTVSKIFEIASPYLEADLSTIFTTQSADTLYIVHPLYAPRTLVRVSDTSWTLTQSPLEQGPFATLNTDGNKHIFCTVTGSNYDPGDTVTLQSNADIFESGHVGSYMYLEERFFSDNNVSAWTAGTVSGATGTQVSNAGNVYEAVAGGNTRNGLSPPTHTDGEAWDNPEGDTVGKMKWRYLHSRWAIVQLTTFTDSKNMAGTIKTRLPNGLAPIARTITNVTNVGGICRVTSNGHGYGVGDYVHIAGVVGATQANGSWRVINAAANTFELEGSSAPSAYTSGGTAKRYSTWLWRHGAFSTARGFPKTVAIHEQRLCYANTTLQPFGFWASRAGDYPNFLPGTEDDDSIAYNVASNKVDPIRWLMSGSNLLLGTLAQEQAAYGGGLGDPITPTNTRIVPQSAEGSNGVHPETAGGDVIFCNRAGRKLFAIGYQADANQYLATDLIELAEHLTVGKTIKQIAWAKNPLSVLWCLRSDGTLLSLTYRKEQQVVAWARHVLTGAMIEAIAVVPSQDGTTDDLWLVVARTINGATKRYIEYLAPPFEPTSATDKNLMGFVDSALRYSGAPVTAFSGLWHLEGQTVSVVADGAMHADKVVSGGKFSLDRPATNVWAGLGYTSRLKTLRPEQAAQVTAQGKTKRIPRMTVRVMNAIGGKAGPYSEAVMDELVPRRLEDPMDASPPLFTGDVDVTLASDFGLDARLSIVQDLPMPLDIISIMPLLSVSEG